MRTDHEQADQEDTLRMAHVEAVEVGGSRDQAAPREAGRSIPPAPADTAASQAVGGRDVEPASDDELNWFEDEIGKISRLDVLETTGATE